MSAVDVTAIVIAHGRSDDLRRCIGALRRTRYRPLHVFVLDNGSSDAAAIRAATEPAEAIQLLRSDRNLGFAGGMNFALDVLAARRSAPSIYAMVNPDCIVDPGWLGPLVATLIEDARVAVAGGRLFELDGTTLQHAGGVIHANGLTDHIGRGCTDRNAFRSRADVDYVTGALCALRSGLIERIGAFDEQYHPAYFEEADFCVRAREHGYRVVYDPESEALHAEGSTLGRDSRQRVAIYHRNRMRFVARHLLDRGRAGAAVAGELRWLLRRPGRSHAAGLLAAYVGLAGDLLRARRAAP